MSKPTGSIANCISPKMTCDSPVPPFPFPPQAAQPGLFPAPLFPAHLLILHQSGVPTAKIAMAQSVTPFGFYFFAFNSIHRKQESHLSVESQIFLSHEAMCKGGPLNIFKK